MKPSEPKSTAILAAAGSRKTEHVIDAALAVTNGRVLITTYTNENQQQIISRIERKVGVVPPNVYVMGWFAFLIQQCARPYQRALTGEPLAINGLNFDGKRSMYARKTDLRFFLDSKGNLYRDGVSDFVVQLNLATKGKVVKRLERIFTHIFVDEFQDFVGYDLDVLDLLISSSIHTTMVGDPRQHLIATNCGSRNKQFRGIGLKEWFEGRKHLCDLQHRIENFRSNQVICDFADGLYPNLPKTVSVGVDPTHHDGIFQLEKGRVHEYVSRFAPVKILRHDKRADTDGLHAMNIGLSKGSTFDRVVIFPTQPMIKYLRDGDASCLEAPAKLYVAVTRARYSVTFVVPKLIAGCRVPTYVG